MLKELLINVKKWIFVPWTAYIAEEGRHGLIPNLCRTHDYIVLATLVSIKRPNFIYRTFTKLQYILTCIYD